MKTVVTYSHAHLSGHLVSLCADCQSDYDAHGATREIMGVLGPVSHGAHEGQCEGCQMRHVVGELADAHLLATGQRIDADSDADEIVGEDSWQVPEELEHHLTPIEVRDAVLAEIARRIAEARAERRVRWTDIDLFRLDGGARVETDSAEGKRALRELRDHGAVAGYVLADPADYDADGSAPGDEPDLWDAGPSLNAIDYAGLD